jgi:hypothetical protein
MRPKKDSDPALVAVVGVGIGMGKELSGNN